MFAQFSARVLGIVRLTIAHLPRWLPRGALALTLTALILQACSRAPSAPFAGPDPSDPSAPVATSRYRSTTAGYPSQRPVEPRPWLEQNRGVTPAPKQ